MTRRKLRDYVRTARTVRAATRLMSARGRADPYPVVKRIQRIAPVIYIPPHNWIVTRYEEVSAVLRDPRFSSDMDTRFLIPGWEERIREFRKKHKGITFRSSMLFKDGSDHERLRSLVSRAFTPRMIESLRARIQQIADGLLDAAEPKGRMDLVADFAYPLPVTVICELLGVPPEERGQLRDWTAKVARSLDPSMNAEQQAGIIAAGDEASELFTAYFTPLIEQRRVDPREDLLSALVQAQDGGDRLTTEELHATCVLLLVAGHETTTNLIANGTLALLRNPAELDKVRSDPSPERVKTTIEEFLRYDPPVVVVLRIAKEDVALGGTVVPAGHDVYPVIAAANRDPRQFPNPDVLDVDRTDNKHLTFSGGPHFCLGAPLARLEGQIAFSTLLQRFPKLTLQTDAPEWRDTITLRSLTSLPVSF
jgi:cytochrome P450